jgi:hypothetical protein
VLKKAGIVVAAATAAMLAVSPLAFANDSDDDHGVSIEDSEDVDLEKTVVKDNEVEFCNNEGQNNESEINNIFPFELPPGSTGVLGDITNSVTQTNVSTNEQCSTFEVLPVPAL